MNAAPWSAALLALTACLGACERPAPGLPDPAAARRVVSLDYCADQFVLKLLDRERILAVSPDADAGFSYMRSSARGVPQVRPVAEDVLVLNPDLVVRSYGGGPNAAAFFEKSGVPVLQLGFAGSVDAVRQSVRAVAEALGVPERGDAIVADMNARLAALKPAHAGSAALYMTPAGVTTGPGTLIHELLEAAELENFQTKAGWHSIPLERLAYASPDLVATAFFGSKTNHVDAWSAANHPVARRQMASVPVIALQGAWTSCGGWFLVDAVEALAGKTGRAPGPER